MRTQEWLNEVFACIDTRQTQAFVTYLREDASLRYGSNPDVHGRAAIAAFVNQVFASFHACSHRLERYWDTSDCRIAQGVVTYTRLDGSKVSLPFCNVLTMKGDLVARYEIFIDPTPMMSASLTPSADPR